MTRLWRDLRARLGDVALASIALIAMAMLFQFVAVSPLEARLALLDGRLASSNRHTAADSLRTGTPAAKLAAFYAFFDLKDGQVDWLARLYGNASAAGIELRSADYRLVDTNGRLVRYEATLPLSGSYAQIRIFLEAALEENPLLSLDQLNIRRKRVNDTRAEAEAVVTIHLLKP